MKQGKLNMSEVILEMRNSTKTFPRRKSVDNVSFSVGKAYPRISG
jgi:ABC-type sugar transport system ATPase subunit